MISISLDFITKVDGQFVAIDAYKVALPVWLPIAVICLDVMHRVSVNIELTLADPPLFTSRRRVGFGRTRVRACHGSPKIVPDRPTVA